MNLWYVINFFIIIFSLYLLFLQELQEHGHDLPQTKANLNVNSAKNRYVNILPCKFM